MKIQLLFGSTSDHEIYAKIADSLKENSFDVDVKILSAHRNPEDLAEFLTTAEYDLIIAGAGLAAHLPGVVASKVECPVIGIPVKAALAGLDAFLSILQMPAGVPVLTLAPEQELFSVGFIKSLENFDTDTIYVYADEKTAQIDSVVKEIEKAQKVISDKGIKCEMHNDIANSQIILIDIFNPPSLEAVIHKDRIYVPVVEKAKTQEVETAIQLQKIAQTKGGLWVGMNNLRNALIAAQQLSKVVKK